MAENTLRGSPWEPALPEGSSGGKTVSQLVEYYGMPGSAEMLLEVNNAILTILKGGQSYRIGSRSLTRADLALLYKMRQEIEANLNASDGSAGLFDDCYAAVWDQDPR